MINLPSWLSARRAMWMSGIFRVNLLAIVIHTASGRRCKNTPSDLHFSSLCVVNPGPGSQARLTRCQVWWTGAEPHAATLCQQLGTLNAFVSGQSYEVSMLQHVPILGPQM